MLGALGATLTVIWFEKGVPGARLVAEGYGPTRPVADNTTPPGRDKNRRTEFVILKQ